MFFSLSSVFWNLSVPEISSMWCRFRLLACVQRRTLYMHNSCIRSLESHCGFQYSYMPWLLATYLLVNDEVIENVPRNWDFILCISKSLEQSLVQFWPWPTNTPPFPWHSWSTSMAQRWFPIVGCNYSSPRWETIIT